MRPTVKSSVALLFVTAVVSASVLSLRAATTFGAPVKVTPNLGFGYEPAVVVDPTGNIFVTAHKENWQLVVAPDMNAPLYTRSMSWVWWSVNNGASFTDVPGLMGSFFGPDEKLSVVWTRRVLGINGVATLARDIYYARSF